MLEILAPQVANRSCEHCQKFVYNEETGEVVTNRDGSPRLRIAQNKPPCRTPGSACPKGTPEDSLALNDKNWQAYRHYTECKAAGHFPNDGIVLRNAGIISRAEQRAERLLACRRHQDLIEILAARF